jgi:hypothetical protein
MYVCVPNAYTFLVTLFLSAKMKKTKNYHCGSDLVEVNSQVAIPPPPVVILVVLSEYHFYNRACPEP